MTERQRKQSSKQSSKQASTAETVSSAQLSLDARFAVVAAPPAVVIPARVAEVVAPERAPTVEPTRALEPVPAAETEPSPRAEDRVRAPEAKLAAVGGASTEATAVADGPGPTSAPRIFRVAELVRSARLMLESRFTDVRVEGELSRLTRSGPGHLYFCLKDDTAVVDCVMFAREAARLKFKPEEGTAVLVRGRLTIFEGRGKFQLSATSMEPTGAGALALAFEQLKKRLAAEGLFDPARKRPIPFLPRRIGVVTSPTGAVIRDIIHVAHRRFPARILLSPTIVQGADAAPRIAAALAALSRVPDVDVIIVARGGGSLEDLWAFNEEPLARAIAACPVPVISAVGHETDFTIADFVADLRCPTPSAAAERAVPVAAELQTELKVMCRRAASAVEARLRTARLTIERARTRLGDPRRLLDERRQALDELATRIERRITAEASRRRAELRQAEMALLRAHPQRRIAEQRTALAALEQRLTAAAKQALEQRRRDMATCGAKLDGLSPLRVLDRGYGLVRAPKGELITRASQIAPGDLVSVTLREGDITARVEKVEPGRGKALKSGAAKPGT